MKNQTKNQKESAAKGWTIAVVMLFILAVVLVSQKSCTAQQTGYLLSISTQGGKVEITKTPNIADVYTLAAKHFPTNCTNFSRELTRSAYYTIESQQTQFYVEVKRITKNGKYRRLSTRQFSKLTAATSSPITINHHQSPSITQ